MNHNTIYQGNAIEVLKEFKEDCVNYTLTSPPYNNPSNHIINKGKGIYRHYTDNMTEEEYYNFLKSILQQLIRVTKKYIFLNIMYNTDNKTVLCKLLGEFAEHIKDILIWEKPIQPAMCNYVLTHNYEFIFVFSKTKENRKYDINFGNKGEYRTCFKGPSNNAFNKERFKCEGNFAIMPIQIARYILTTFTKEGDIILDPFLGSGTTAVACAELNRKYIGIEIDKNMIDIAKKRLSQIQLTFLK